MAVCMVVCVYVWLYVFLYLCMYVCTYLGMPSSRPKYNRIVIKYKITGFLLTTASMRTELLMGQNDIYICVCVICVRVCELINK